MTNQFVCIVFLADDKHISQVETCETASEAITRAKQWCALGHIARAYLEVVDLERLEIYHFPLN